MIRTLSFFVLMSGLLTAAPTNIVFVITDDQGYGDLACTGNPIIKTPHIDKLASEGIKLTNFYVNSPICSASRVALTTGQYQGRWKIHSFLNTRAGNANRGMANYLAASAPTTAKKLKAAGYATAHFGKWHIGGGGPPSGPGRTGSVGGPAGAGRTGNNGGEGATGRTGGNGGTGPLGAPCMVGTNSSRLSSSRLSMSKSCLY